MLFIDTSTSSSTNITTSMTTSTTTTSTTTATTASANDTTATTTGTSETTTKGTQSQILPHVWNKVYKVINYVSVCKDEWWCKWRPQWTCNYLPILKKACPKKCGACEEETTTSTATTTTTTATTESCKDQFDFWCRMNFWRCRFSGGIRRNCPSTCGLCWWVQKDILI